MTATGGSNILYHGSNGRIAFQSGTLEITGNSGAGVSQTFTNLVFGLNRSGYPGEIYGAPQNGAATINLVSNGQDVVLSTGMINHAGPAAINFVLPTFGSPSTPLYDGTGAVVNNGNGVATTAVNDSTGILGGWAVVSDAAGNADFATVSGGTHVAAAPDTTVTDIAGTWEVGFNTAGELAMFTDAATAASLTVGTPVALNSITGAGSGAALERSTTSLPLRNSSGATTGSPSAPSRVAHASRAPKVT